MRGYSFFNLVRHALNGHRRWPRAWRDPDLKPSYDVVVVGAGGHGLATAFYLARDHGIRNVAVLEKGYLGGGNSGRNTQVTRSNYFYPQSAAFYDRSLQLYERLSETLNFNVMLSQRGIVSLAHSEHELEVQRRWANAIGLNGIDSEILSPAELKKRVPILNPDCRLPVVGGFIQRRGGISRHDAVVWGYARAADALGVDIIQQCEVRGFHVNGNRVTSVHTSRGDVGAGRVALCVAGHSSVMMDQVGVRLPITSMALQAMVSEPVKPLLDTVVMSAAIHGYASQSDRGELVMGGGADSYNSYAQRGSLTVTRASVEALIELFPCFSRLKLLRQWAGIVDIAPDASPIIGKTPVDNLYLSTGWGTGGYKAIPVGGEALAATIAHNRAHPLIEPFALDRFARGALIDEGAAAGVAH